MKMTDFSLLIETFHEKWSPLISSQSPVSRKRSHRDWFYRDFVQ